jgi:hypothetical protein
VIDEHGDDLAEGYGRYRAPLEYALRPGPRAETPAPTRAPNGWRRSLLRGHLAVPPQLRSDDQRCAALLASAVPLEAAELRATAAWCDSSTTPGTRPLGLALRHAIATELGLRSGMGT